MVRRSIDGLAEIDLVNPPPSAGEEANTRQTSRDFIIDTFFISYLLI
jgi:hypothetical protein